jgi:hypothetical protein
MLLLSNITPKQQTVFLTINSSYNFKLSNKLAINLGKISIVQSGAYLEVSDITPIT